MNRYSKMMVNSSDNNTSGSSDFPDLMPFPQPPTNSVSPHNHQTEDGEGEGEMKDKRFGEALSRARSVSSSSTTPRAIHCAVKRAFSMRRSSSVSEGYSRIHDQPTLVEDGDDEGGVGIERSGKKKGKRGKILKVCKLLFGR